MTTQNEMTVEQALKELREMFPSSFGYVDQSVIANYGRHGQEVRQTVQIQVHSEQEGILFAFSAPSFDEAMAQVREWKASNE